MILRKRTEPTEKMIRCSFASLFSKSSCKISSQNALSRTFFVSRLLISSVHLSYFDVIKHIKPYRLLSNLDNNSSFVKNTKRYIKGN